MATGGAILLGPLAVAGMVGVWVVWFLVCGLLWAVPAGLISARIAIENGFGAANYAKTGALYSALNLALWVYLVMRMCGKEISQSLIRKGYIALFTVWMISSVLFNFAFAFLSFQRDDLRIASLMFGIFGIVSGVLWVVARQRLENHSRNHAPTSSEEIVVHSAYILPFAFFFVSFMLPWLIQRLLADSL